MFGHRTPDRGREPEQSIPRVRPATDSVPALPSPLDLPTKLLLRTLVPPVTSGTCAPTNWRAEYRSAWDALPRAASTELFHVLMIPDFDRADAIGSSWGNPKTRTFADLVIDCEEDRTLRAVLVGMLRERTELSV
jgi:hypothetical protein